MAGIDAIQLMVYPKELTDADWQKKKELLSKTIKTGLGAELKKGEALHKKIKTNKLEADCNAPKSKDDLDQGIKDAKAYFKSHVEPLIAQLKVVVSTAKATEAAMTKAKHKKSAAAAADIAKSADRFAVACKSVDLEATIKRGQERIDRLNMLAANLLNASIKKFIVSAKLFLASDGNMQSWEDNIKQNGRSVSNSVRQLDNYNKAFWAKFQKFQGFDLPTLGLHGDEPKTKEARLKLAREAVKQVADIAKFKG